MPPMEKALQMCWCNCCSIPTRGLSIDCLNRSWPMKMVFNPNNLELRTNAFGNTLGRARLWCRPLSCFQTPGHWCSIGAKDSLTRSYADLCNNPAKWRWGECRLMGDYDLSEDVNCRLSCKIRYYSSHRSQTRWISSHSTRSHTQIGERLVLPTSGIFSKLTCFPQ